MRTRRPHAHDILQLWDGSPSGDVLCALHTSCVERWSVNTVNEQRGAPSCSVDLLSCTLVCPGLLHLRIRFHDNLINSVPYDSYSVPTAP
eukprot:360440-Chlamydomonas_euryale.AAC.5